MNEKLDLEELNIIDDLEGHEARVAEAFSRKALVYDDFAIDHPNLERMRRKVRVHALRWLLPGDRILEMNAGTGEDALFFASRGFRVHATDLASGMIARIQAKASRAGLQELLTAQQCSFSALAKVNRGPFEYVFSNMGGLNCTDDLEEVIRGLKPLLVPGAIITWVIMPPICLWELSRLLRGDPRGALRRLSPHGIIARVEGMYFKTCYYPPSAVRRAFGKEFSPLALQGLSVITPTADEKEFPSRHPRLYQWLRGLDDRLADLPPFNRWGDFYILSVRYQPGSDDRPPYR